MSSTDQTPAPPPRRILVAAILGSILGNGAILLLWYPLFTVPEGSSIRPMMQSLVTFVIAFATLGFGGMSSLALLAAPGRRVLGTVCGLLSLAPFPLTVLLVRGVCHWRHLTLAP